MFWLVFLKFLASLYFLMAYIRCFQSDPGLITTLCPGYRDIYKANQKRGPGVERGLSFDEIPDNFNSSRYLKYPANITHGLMFKTQTVFLETISKSFFTLTHERRFADTAAAYVARKFKSSKYLIYSCGLNFLSSRFRPKH